MLYSQSLYNACLCPFSNHSGPGPLKYLGNELMGTLTS